VYNRHKIRENGDEILIPSSTVRMKFYVRDRDLIGMFTFLIYCVIFLCLFNYIGSDDGLDVKPKLVTCYVILLLVTIVFESTHMIQKQQGGTV
jgi:hypothetical protein